MTYQSKIVDQKAADQKYLHRDFHGALAYAIKYLDENFGPEALAEYFQQVADNCYQSLTQQIKARGLPALSEYLYFLYIKESGRFSIYYEKGVLVIDVEECPAISHLKKTNQLFTERYCESTVLINEAICRNAGYRCSCKYEPGMGACVQKFWKEKEA